ncbi:cyclase-dehydratase [Amycolatopsis mediterranei S699]|uniref:Cyclase-dehydratase n=2 Tax=Amycolatopsis mediterranei TaxID=33910 RepID=A0A9R0UBY4_AMYMS|nr:cyclase [Amycolatopsis mediterranei]ADJ48390.1 putative cyclase-dehydratase [Amycolatopsis mediterranei U32]AEK45311.1 cyclase-dehydratase [Amycolatopsis mediterranei S699]AFO80101.1 cyclase-dehydratase [Amycolatopsis mediterranei S699]AGT87229.1 cyclase-dehydratase [Amycolatopsis mediterranei RB]KDO10909.1 cyclase [Amycolatopsis mediterranei]
MKALHFSRLAALIAAAVLPIALAAPASAATSVTFDCQADAPIVGPQKVALNQDADVTAPATVAPGGAFDVVIDPAPNTVPSTVSGNKVKNINTFALKIPIPANSSYVGADLTGGSGLGSTPPALSVANGVATLSFPGPIAGGATFELPTVTAHLTAGQSGTIQTKLGGTSYSDPGLTFKAVASTIIGDLTAPTACFPNPSPVFTTTTIG